MTELPALLRPKSYGDVSAFQVGGPYAVLVAEELHASGCELIIR